MAISTFNVRHQYTGNGSLASYTFDFKLATAAHLKVIVANASFVETFRVLGTDTVYLTSVTFSPTVAGGTVVLASNLPSGHYLYLLLADDEPLQSSEFKDKSDFTLSRFESVLDVIVRAIQRLAYLSKRSLKVPETVLNATAFDGELPTFTANTILATNVAGNGFKMAMTVPDLEANVAAAQASEDAAAISEANAAASAAAAAVSETNAATSETNAATSASNASTSETNAATSASNASTSASNAATSASNAATSETNAATSASNASTSETNAATSASNAATSETNAATSASNAATSETNAATSETNAAISAAAAAASAPALYSTVTAAGAYAPTTAASRFILFDATLGNQSLTLPAITGANDGLTFTGKKIDASANTVTFTGTIEGEVNPVIDQRYTGRTVVAIGSAWYWKN